MGSESDVGLGMTDTRDRSKLAKNIRHRKQYAATAQAKDGETKSGERLNPFR